MGGGTTRWGSLQSVSQEIKRVGLPSEVGVGKGV